MLSSFFFGFQSVDAHWGLGSHDQSENCPPDDLQVEQNFDLESYIDGPWWIQEQMPTSYLPVSENQCVKAQYSKGLVWWKRLLGWSIQVENFSLNQDSGSFLCARQTDPDNEPAKLEVAPCFLAAFLAGGPYWVLKYDQEQGAALISGGAPTVEGENGKCTTGSGTNDSGLWIFTRQRTRNETLVQSLRDELDARGFDINVLNPVNNADCA